MTQQELAEIFNGCDDTSRRVKKTKRQKRTKSSIRIKTHILNVHGFSKSIALTALLFTGV